MLRHLLTQRFIISLSYCVLFSYIVVVVPETCTFCHIGHTCNAGHLHDLLNVLVDISCKWLSSHIQHISRYLFCVFVHV